MNISRADAEEKLVKVGRITKEQLNRNGKDGKNPVRMANLFVDEVKRDFSAFFPAEPDNRYLKRTALKLFESGGF